MNANPVMAVSVIGILVLLGLLVGGVVLLVALVANKKTRPVGLTLLGLGVFVVLLVGGSVLLWLRDSHVEVRHQQTMAIESASVRADRIATASDDYLNAKGRPSTSTVTVDNAPSNELFGDQNTTAAAHGAHLSKGQVGSTWAKLLLVLVGLGVLYGLTKLLNSGQGQGLAVAGALGVAMLVGGVVVVNHYKFSPMPADVSEAPTNQAWEEVTRPRIDLSDRTRAVAEKPLGPHADSPTIELQNKQRRLAQNATNEQIAEEIGSAQKDLGEEKKLTLKVNGATLTFTSDTPMSAVIKAIEAAREDTEPEATLADRPAWVDQQPKRIGQVYRQVVEVGPFVTIDECYRKLGQELLVAAREFAARRLPTEPSEQFMKELGITSGSLMREVCVDEFVDTFYSESVGQDMNRLYVQVEFDQAFGSRLDQAYAAWERRDAVAALTLLGGGVLLMLGGVLGLLKLDEATKGFYTKRLFLGVPAAIIAVIVLLALTAELRYGLFL